MEDTELVQDRGAVVVDFFSGEAVGGVERVNAKKGDFDSAAGRGKAAPSAEMRAADDDFHQNGVVGDMAALDVDFQVRQRLHKLFVKLADSVGTMVVIAPRFIVILCGRAEGTENTFEIVLVLESNVLLNQGDTGRVSFLENIFGSISRRISRNGCTCHVHLPSRRRGAVPATDITIANLSVARSIAYERFRKSDDFPATMASRIPAWLKDQGW